MYTDHLTSSQKFKVDEKKNFIFISFDTCIWWKWRLLTVNQNNDFSALTFSEEFSRAEL